jgi:hypothetical protein
VGTPAGPAETAAIVAVCMALIELVKYLVGKLTKTNGGLSRQEHRMLEQLADAHSRVDNDGVPLHIMPRSYGETQRTIARSLQEMAMRQHDIARILERWDAQREQRGEP